MDFLSSLLSNASLKRAVVGAVTAALIAGNKKLGLGLEVSDVVALVTLAVAFIGQSAVKEVRLAGVEAAAKVADVPAAVAVINEAAKP